jgi:HEAT repeat protein
VDVINTDHPRLASEALGRGIEKRALALLAQARTGDVKAIAELGGFRDLPLAKALASLVSDARPLVSRAAAVALVKRGDAASVPVLLSQAGPGAPAHFFANAAWAVGMLGANPAGARWLVEQAGSTDPNIATEALRALSRIEISPVPKELLLRRLNDASGMVRGAAARALARHVPASAPAMIAEAKKLQGEIHAHWATYADAPEVNAFGKHRTTFERPAPADSKAIEQIAKAQDLYRGYHNLLQALASLPDPAAKRWLHEQVLRNESDFSGYASYVAAFQLWDRADPEILAPGLAMDDPMRRDRVEWTLIKRGASGAPALRKMLASADSDARLRAAQALAWIGDGQSRSAIQGLMQTDSANRDMYEWCLKKLGEVERLAAGGL